MKGTIEERFWSKVDKSGDCWIWKAGKDRKGYGQININHQQRRAHRVSYVLCVGEIPDGLVIDHLCRNRACVNPDHLEPVTQRENIIRGDAGIVMAQIHRSKTHCPSGHEYTPENTEITRQRKRNCRECKRAGYRKWYSANKQYVLDYKAGKRKSLNRQPN